MSIFGSKPDNPEIIIPTDYGKFEIQKLKSIGKKRLLIPFPLKIAEVSARFFEIMPNPILTRDQLRLLKYNNIPSGKYKTNFDLKMYANKKFDEEINRYSYNWTIGGQFSKKRIDNLN